MAHASRYAALPLVDTLVTSLDQGRTPTGRVGTGGFSPVRQAPPSSLDQGRTPTGRIGTGILAGHARHRRARGRAADWLIAATPSALIAATLRAATLAASAPQPSLAARWGLCRERGAVLLFR